MEMSWFYKKLEISLLWAAVYILNTICFVTFVGVFDLVFDLDHVF